jgi:hypothetical protein
MSTADNLQKALSVIVLTYSGMSIVYLNRLWLRFPW